MIRAFFSNSVGILVSRIFGFLRDLLTAQILGAGVYSDIFFVAFKLPNLFRRLFAEGAFVQAFLPSFVKSAKKGLFAASILIKFSFIILSLTIVVTIFAPFFTKILAFGFSQEVILKSVLFVRINFWYLFLIFLVTFLASILQYKNHFATTAFSTALLNISMIGALLISKNKTQPEIVEFLSYGVVFGGIFQLLAHLIAIKYVGMFKVLSGGIYKFIKGERADTNLFKSTFLSGIVGNSAAQLASFFNTWFASFLSAGSISYLYYADRIFQLPLAIFAIALTTAMFPKITKLIKAKDEQNALKMLSKAFHFLLFFLLLATIFGCIFSEEIIRLIFGRGKFTQNDVLSCAPVLFMYMFGLIPYGLSKLFSLWLYAHLKQKLAAKITIASLLINVVFCFIFVWDFEVRGLALASSISGFCLFFMTIYFFGFKKFLNIIDLKKGIFTIIVCVAFGYIFYLLRGFLDAVLF